MVCHAGDKLKLTSDDGLESHDRKIHMGVSFARV